MFRIIHRCPACGGSHFEIERIRCVDCDTAVEGKFTISRLGSLPFEHQEFIELFLKCRGNIKDVERELGVSYPTVRGRLDRAISALGFADTDQAERRKEILVSLSSKEISPEEAVKALKDIKV